MKISKILLAICLSFVVLEWLKMSNHRIFVLLEEVLENDVNFDSWFVLKFTIFTVNVLM